MLNILPRQPAMRALPALSTWRKAIEAAEEVVTFVAEATFDPGMSLYRYPVTCQIEEYAVVLAYNPGNCNSIIEAVVSEIPGWGRQHTVYPSRRFWEPRPQHGITCVDPSHVAQTVVRLMREFW